MFWTSWCHYCKVKLREFNRGDLCEESVPVFFINIGEKQPVVKEFAGRMKLRECMYNNILMDKEGALAAKMGVVGIPMFILFEDGKEAGRGYSLDKNFMDEAFD